MGAVFVIYACDGTPSFILADKMEIILRTFFSPFITQHKLVVILTSLKYLRHSNSSNEFWNAVLHLKINSLVLNYIMDPSIGTPFYKLFYLFFFSERISM